MTNAELQKLIEKKLALIARLEAKAARCNVATALGRALASRAETSAAYHRKLVAGLRNRLGMTAG